MKKSASRIAEARISALHIRKLCLYSGFKEHYDSAHDMSRIRLARWLGEYLAQPEMATLSNIAVDARADSRLGGDALTPQAVDFRHQAIKWHAAGSQAWHDDSV